MKQKEAALIIIKPDGFHKGVIGNILLKFSQANLEIIALKIAKSSRELAEQHYQHIKNQPFFEDVMSYFTGKYHGINNWLVIIYYGENAIKKCRKIAGATNPEEADPKSIRGSYGRITTKGTFENVVHVSSDPSEAKREIKIWFKPEDIVKNLYATKWATIAEHKEKVWA